MSNTENSLAGTLTLDEVAASLNVSNMTARRIVKSGEIPAVIWRGKYFIKRNDLSDYLARAVQVYRAARPRVPA